MCWPESIWVIRGWCNSRSRRSRLTDLPWLGACHDRLVGKGINRGDFSHDDFRSVVEWRLLGVINLWDIDPGSFREGMQALGGELLPDVVWLERGVKIPQERAGISLSDVDLARHACSSCALEGNRKKNAPGATARGRSELDSLVSRVHRNSASTL